VQMDRYWASQLSEEFLQLWRQHFYSMHEEDFAKLVRLGAVREFQPGELVVTQGENNRYVRLVLDGELQVLRDAKLTYLLETANFISEAGLHAGLLLPGKIESCCTIVANTKTRLLVWDRTQLVELMEHDAGVRRALKGIMTWDIVSKLKYQRCLLSMPGQIDDPEEWTKRRNEQNRHRYAAILHNILSHPSYLKTGRNILNKYRSIHHIDDQAHNSALVQVGWTPEEFEAGRKNGHQEDAEDSRCGWDWYVREYYLRVFGY
jgi:CRP-like cAMP-binding protein